MSGSMWQGMETKTFGLRRHPLTLPPDGAIVPQGGTPQNFVP
jgi:hypothetical protein